MSGIETDEITPRSLAPFSEYLICFLDDEDKMAVFVPEEVRYRNIGNETRDKVKYESVDENQDISSIVFLLNDIAEAIVHC